MSFLKKMFSGKTPPAKTTAASEQEYKGIITEDYFHGRYTLQNLDEDPKLLDGCMKMVESYFLDNKIERNVQYPVNHPVNLDQTMNDGFGFNLYCRAFQLGEEQAAMFLAMAFSDFMIKELGFKLYQDSQPEYPLRGMTLKYDKNGALLSLYPYEYAVKVLNFEADFESLYDKVKSSLENIPSVDDLLSKL